MAVSLRESVAWVAQQISLGDNIFSDTPEQIAGYPCTHLLAYQFERDPLEIAVAIIRFRREKLKPMAQGGLELAAPTEGSEESTEEAEEEEQERAA